MRLRMPPGSASCISEGGYFILKSICYGDGGTATDLVLGLTARGREQGVLQNLRSPSTRERLSAGVDLTRWTGAIALAVAIAIAYFLAARLSLAMLTKPDGVAVFWPAAGVAAGV